jgi:hypothetical protein
MGIVPATVKEGANGARPSASLVVAAERLQLMDAPVGEWILELASCTSQVVAENNVTPVVDQERGVRHDQKKDVA